MVLGLINERKCSVMFTYALFNADGSVHSVGRSEELPDAKHLEINTPEGGFFLDLTGQGDFDSMDILDIHNHYQADAKKAKLVKRK